MADQFDYALWTAAHGYTPTTSVAFAHVVAGERTLAEVQLATGCLVKVVLTDEDEPVIGTVGVVVARDVRVCISMKSANGERLCDS